MNEAESMTAAQFGIVAKAYLFPRWAKMKILQPEIGRVEKIGWLRVRDWANDRVGVLVEGELASGRTFTHFLGLPSNYMEMSSSRDFIRELALVISGWAKAMNSGSAA